MLPVRTPDPPERTSLPSGVAAAAPAADRGLALTSLVLTGVILLGVALFTLAALPTRQLVLLPGARWIAMKRLDLVIGGMAAIIGVLGALLIAELMP